MFKVTLDTSAIGRLSGAAKEAVDRIVKNSQFKNELAKSVVDDIVGMTRSGKSVVTGRPFEKLSQGWIETRRKIIAYQGAPSYVSATRANLSLSGQLLSSLSYKIKGSGVSSFEASYFFTGRRKPYRYQGKKGVVVLNSKLTNEELGKVLDDRYRFIGIRPKLQQQLVKRLVDYYMVTISKLTRRG